VWKLTFDNHINIIFSPIQRMSEIFHKIFLFIEKNEGKKTEIKEKKNRGVIFQWYEEEPRTRRWWQFHAEQSAELSSSSRDQKVLPVVPSWVPFSLALAKAPLARSLARATDPEILHTAIDWVISIFWKSQILMSWRRISFCVQFIGFFVQTGTGNCNERVSEVSFFPSGGFWFRMLWVWKDMSLLMCFFFFPLILSSCQMTPDSLSFLLN